MTQGNASNLFRMAVRFRKGARLRSPPLTGSKKHDVTTLAAGGTEDRLEPAILQTEVHEDFRDAGDDFLDTQGLIYAPLMTEDVGAKSHRNLTSTILFNNGKGPRRDTDQNTTVADQKKILKQELQLSQRSKRRKSLTTAPRLEIEGSQTARLRATSQYFRKDEQSHQ